MKSKLALVGLGLGAWLFFVVITVPAYLVTGVLSSASIYLNSVDGSLWSGTAKSAQIGAVAFGETTWRLKPLSIFVGQIKFHIRAGRNMQFAEGNIAASINGSLHIDSVRASLPLAAFAGAIPAGEMNGDLVVRLEEMTLSGDWPESLTGTINIGDLVAMIPPMSQPAVLGNYVADLQITDGSALQVQFRDNGAPFSIDGSITITPQLEYQGNGLVGATAETPAELRDMLRMVGPESGDGRYEFAFSGTY